MVLRSYVGAPVKRKEDPRLITGSSIYVDDLTLPGMVHVAIVRSPYAHAKITGIDTAAALSHAGRRRRGDGAAISQPMLTRQVPGRGTTRDRASGRRSRSRRSKRTTRSPSRASSRWRGARCATSASRSPRWSPTSKAQAAGRRRGGRGRLRTRWRRSSIPTRRGSRAHRSSTTTSRTTSACARRRSTATSTRALARRRDPGEGQDPRRRVAIPMPMETRGVVAAPDPITRGLTIWTSNQGPHGFRNEIASAFGLGQNQVRAIAPEVGGGFGCKFGAYPEDFVAAALALHAEAAGQVDRDAQRALPGHQPRPQPVGRVRGRRRPGRPHPGAARRGSCSIPAPIPKALDLAWCTWVMSTGPYEIPNLDYVVEGRLHQHGGERRLPRRGTPGGDLLPRAVDGPDRRRGRARPGRGAPGQLHPAGQVPLHHALRRALRHRRVREAARPGAGAGRLSTAAAGAGRAAQAGPLPRHRPRLLRRDLRVRSVGELHGARRAGRRGDDLHRHLAARSGAGDDLRPARRRLHRRRFRQGDRPPRRHRQHAARQRHRRQPRPRRRRRGAGALAQQDQGARPSAIAAHMLEAAVEDIELVDGKYRVKGVPTGGAHPGRDRRSRPTAAACRTTSTPGWNRPTSSSRPTRPSRSARMSRWSRSSPRPARSSSCATSRSTTAATSSARCW